MIRPLRILLAIAILQGLQGINVAAANDSSDTHRPETNPKGDSSLSEKLDRNKGVLHPAPGVDPEMAKPAPQIPSNTPVIPPHTPGAK